MSYDQSGYGYGRQGGYYSYGEDLKVIAYRHLTTALLVATFVVLAINLIFHDPADPLLVTLYIIGSIVEGGIILILIFSAFFRHQFSESTALTMLNIFAVASSLTLAYMVNVVTNYLSNGLQIVTLTFGISAVTVFGMYAYTSANKPDVTGWYKWVMVMAIAFIVLALIGMIFYSSNPFVYLLISIGGAALFAVFMYMDFARLERRQFSSPAMMALMLFYDIIYFVKYLLQILVMVMGERK